MRNWADALLRLDVVCPWRNYALRITHYALCFVLASCTIEPPLHLPQDEVDTTLPITITDLDAIWGVEGDWREGWWYGWDKEDERMWGKIEYPEPTYFEVRRFYQGEEQSGFHELQDGFTIYGSSFRRHYYFGYYNLLVWSNIDSPDGTQTILIDEHDYDNIIATTTKTSVSYNRAPNRVVALKNQPEIFYNVHERDFHVSRNTEDYDYYDEEERAWVKTLRTTLSPVVYIYLVQVLIYNNNGRIRGLADNATVLNMAEGVNLNTSQTLTTNVDVTYAMRLKPQLPVRDGLTADVMGGKFHTFGLCDIEGWKPTRNPQYAGSRTDLANDILLPIQFSNNTEKTFAYDVTGQMRGKVHGGVLTIEIDADTITIPTPDTQTGSGFKPTVEEYEDSVTHEFGI